MPGNGKYGWYPDSVPITSPYGPAGGPGASDVSLIRTLFLEPASGDRLTMEGVKNTANRELVPDVLPKNPDPMIYSLADISLGFGAAPDITSGPFDDQLLKEGGPANPYFPNLTSPDPEGGTINPVIPLPLTDSQVSPRATRDVDGLVNPARTSLEMSNQTKIGKSLFKGKRPGSV